MPSLNISAADIQAIASAVESELGDVKTAGPRNVKGVVDSVLGRAAIGKAGGYASTILGVINTPGAYTGISDKGGLRGYSRASGRPSPATVEAVKEQIATAKVNGFVNLAPDFANPLNMSRAGKTTRAQVAALDKKNISGRQAVPSAGKTGTHVYGTRPATEESLARAGIKGPTLAIDITVEKNVDIERHVTAAQTFDTPSEQARRTDFDAAIAGKIDALPKAPAELDLSDVLGAQPSIGVGEPADYSEEQASGAYTPDGFPSVGVGEEAVYGQEQAFGAYQPPGPAEWDVALDPAAVNLSDVRHGLTQDQAIAKMGLENQRPAENVEVRHGSRGFGEDIDQAVTERQVDDIFADQLGAAIKHDLGGIVPYHSAITEGILHQSNVPAETIPGATASIMDASSFDTPQDQETPVPMDGATFDAITAPPAPGNVSMGYPASQETISPLGALGMGSSLNINATPRAETGFHAGVDGWNPPDPIGPHAAEFNVAAADATQNARNAVSVQEGRVKDGAERLDAFNNHVATSPLEATLAGIRDQQAAPTIDPLAEGAVGFDEFAGFTPLVTATVEPTVTAATAVPAQAARPETVTPSRASPTPQRTATAVAPSLRAVDTVASVSPTAPAQGQPDNQYAGYKTSQDAMMGIGAGQVANPIDNKAWGNTAFSDSVYAGAAFNDVMDAAAREGNLNPRTEVLGGLRGDVNKIGQEGDFMDAMASPQHARDYSPGLLDGWTGDAIGGAASGLVTGGPIGAILGGITGGLGISRGVDRFIDSITGRGGSEVYDGSGMTGDTYSNARGFSDQGGWSVNNLGADVLAGMSDGSIYGDGGSGKAGGGAMTGGGYGNADGPPSNNGPGLW